MKHSTGWLLMAALASAFGLAGCNAEGKMDPAAGAPPPAKLVEEGQTNLFKVDHPEQFPLATATQRLIAPELNVTGVVSADVSRNVPVVSLASGRVAEIDARVGDTVKKGQLLLRVQSNDVASAMSDYRHAQADDQLANSQLQRAKDLYDRGAVARKDLEVAENAEAKTKVDVQTALEHLRLLGADPNNPAALVDIMAPASGVITEQNVTAAAGVKTLDNSPNLFTISDLSEVWVLCDVFENDLPKVRVGETADIRLDAYPKLVLKGRIDNIGPILDPNLRTAKVRIQTRNPGMLRIGMFVTAVFHGQDRQMRAVIPASAILHLHDRDWVYLPAGNAQFRRVEVTAGEMLPGNEQEILSGVQPGDQVVASALVLQNTVEQ